MADTITQETKQFVQKSGGPSISLEQAGQELGLTGVPTLQQVSDAGGFQPVVEAPEAPVLPPTLPVEPVAPTEPTEPTEPITPITEAPTPDELIQQQVDENNAAIDAELAATNELINSARENLSEQSQRAVSDIQATYERRRAEQVRANQAILASQAIAGARTGRQRFTSEIQNSILSSEESAAISRISALDSEEKSLINQAEQAATTEDFKLLNNLLTAASEARKNKNDEMLSLKQMARDEERLQLSRNKASLDEMKFQLDVEGFFAGEARADRQAEIQERKFELDVEKTIAELTGTFLGEPTFDAQQTALKNTIDIAGLTGDFLGAPTIAEKKRIADESLRRAGINIQAANLNRAIENDAFNQNLAEQKLQLDQMKFAAEQGTALLGEGEKITVKPLEAAKLNKEVANTDAFKALNNASSLEKSIAQFETLLDTTGVQRFGPESKQLSTAYNKLLLEAKEFFNLGVLNGPDLELMQKIVSDPTSFADLTTLPGDIFTPGDQRLQGIKNGINELRKMTRAHIVERFSDLTTAYQDFSPDQLTNIQNAERKLKESSAWEKSLNSYVKSFPEERTLIEDFINNNPRVSDADILDLFQSAKFGLN